MRPRSIAYRVVAGAQQCSIARYGDARHSNVLLRNKLVSTLVLAEIPDSDISTTVTRNELALVGMDDHIVDRAAMRVVTLYAACASIPDLDSTIFRAGDHPFTFAMKGHARNVASMAFESEDRARIGRADIVKLDVVTTSGGEIALVWGYAETIDLRVRMLDGTRADSGKSLPEADGVVVPS